MPKLTHKYLLFIFFGTVLSSLINLSLWAAPDESELEMLRAERNREIAHLEEEIARHSQEVQAARSQARTLESALAELEATENKLRSEAALLEKQIANLEEDINQTDQDITKAENRITDSKDALTVMIRELDDSYNASMLLRLFSHDNFSEIWQTVGDLRQIQDQVTVQLSKINDLRTELVIQKERQDAQRQELKQKLDQLDSRQQSLELAANEQEQLLTVTRSRESEYQALLTERREQKRQFEQELFEIESQLDLNVDPTQIPRPQPGLLSWPLDNIFVTQHFGRTVAAERLYVSGSHNGVDFRASVGTPVRSVADGVVKGTGNTDLVPGCFSYGQWILVEHRNGLSSIYAHLSSINVQEGHTVERGEIIGYSGNTGYSTGPHLHLGVYASHGVEIRRYDSSINCQSAYIPMADRKAYLDPMQYLPPQQN